MDKPAVPPTAVVHKGGLTGKFNLGAMVEQTVLAVYIKTLCQKHELHMQVQFFEGVLAGCDSWYKALNISQDVFDVIQDKLDKPAIQKRAEEYVSKLLEGQNRIVLPAGPDIKAAKVAKEIFDKQFGRKT
jgi:hypothetical protein